MSRIVNDLFETSELAHHGPEDTFMSLISIAGAVVMLCFVNVWLALIVALFVPCMVLFAVKMRGRMHGAFKRSREKIAEGQRRHRIVRVRHPRFQGVHRRKRRKKKSSPAPTANSSGHAPPPTAYMGIFQGGMGFFNDLLYLIALVAGGAVFLLR